MAEKEHDKSIAAWATSPKDVYANFMDKFFTDWDAVSWQPCPSIMSYAGGRHLGTAYLEAVHQNRRMLEALCDVQKRESWGLFDVSLLTEIEDFESLTKRSLLMTDTALLSNSSDTFQEFLCIDTINPQDPYQLCQNMVYRSNTDPEFLKGWLSGLRSNLCSGQLFCLPRTDQQHQMEGGRSERPVENHLYDAVIKNGRVKVLQTENKAKQSFITYLAEVPIPMVNDVSLSNFAEVYNEEFEARNTLKLLLREKFLELDLAKGGELPETILAKIGVKLEREAKLACKDLHRIAKREAVQASGVVFATGVAILAALNMELFTQTAPLISGAGGMAALLKLLESHYENQKKVEDCPYLFLWLLKKSA